MRGFQWPGFSDRMARSACCTVSTCVRLEVGELAAGADPGRDLLPGQPVPLAPPDRPAPSPSPPAPGSAGSAWAAPRASAAGAPPRPQGERRVEIHRRPHHAQRAGDGRGGRSSCGNRNPEANLHQHRVLLLRQRLRTAANRLICKFPCPIVRRPVYHHAPSGMPPPPGNAYTDMRPALALLLLAVQARPSRRAGPAAFPAARWSRRSSARPIPRRATPSTCRAATPRTAPGPSSMCSIRARGGQLAAERFRPGAEKYGYILASSNNSLSDTSIDPNVEAMRAMWTDTHGRLAIDDRGSTPPASPAPSAPAAPWPGPCPARSPASSAPAPASPSTSRRARGTPSSSSAPSGTRTSTTTR